MTGRDKIGLGRNQIGAGRGQILDRSLEGPNTGWEGHIGARRGRAEAARGQIGVRGTVLG